MNIRNVREQRALTNDEIQALAPSAFAGQPYQKQSDRYAFVPTSAVIDGMRNAGFFPVLASQSISRIAEKRNFTKHMIRFRSSDSNVSLVGDSVLETVLINSHDGTSRYVLSMGVFRLVCLNGLMVADSLVASISIKHIGDIINQVIEGSTSILSNAGKVREAITQWGVIDLSAPEQKILAEEAHSLRFDGESTLAEAITPEKLLAPRRYQDNGSDLWSTFNRIQENAVRGGVRGHFYSPETGSRRVRTREVKGIDANLKLNRALWSLAEKMAELKTS